MSLPTPSQLGRVDACLASETLPHAGRVSEWSEGGTVFADFVRDVANLGKDEALERVPLEHREAMAAVPVEQLPSAQPGAWAAEVAFALDLGAGTARELGRGLTREQAHALARPGEMVGIADLVALDVERVWVADYKRSWHRRAVRWQTATYALMAALAYGRRAATHGAVYVPQGGAPAWVPEEMDGLDLDNHLEALRALMERRRLAQTDPSYRVYVEGRHCDFCGAFPSCPVKQARLSGALASQPSPLAELMVNGDRPNDEALAKAWHDIDRTMDVLQAAQEVLRGLARVRPIDLGDGHVLGEEMEERETLVPGLVWEALRARWGVAGEALYAAAVKVELPKETLREALRRMVLPASGVKMAQLEREVFGVLREVRAVSVSVAPVVRVRKLDKKHKRLSPGGPLPSVVPATRPDGEPGAVAVSPALQESP